MISDYILNAYMEKHRKYHTIEHVLKMLDYCGIEREGNNMNLWYAILFHDFVYDPSSATNEEDSAKEWLKISNPKYNSCFADNGVDRERVAELIKATKYTFRSFPNDSEMQLIVDADTAVFLGSEEDLIKYEEGIFYEYQKFPLNIYMENRIEFLKSAKEQFTDSTKKEACDFLINYIRNKTYKVGIYAGSFNPFHKGHENIVEQAEKHFDKIIIAQLWNREKEYPENKVDNFRQCISHSGLLSDLFNEELYSDKSLIRGIRSSFDVIYEQNLRSVLQETSSVEIPVVYYFCDKQFEHISSSMIRGLYHFGKEIYGRYLA